MTPCGRQSPYASGTEPRCAGFAPAVIRRRFPISSARNGSNLTPRNQGAPTPGKRSPTGPGSGELDFPDGGGPPDAAWQIPRWTASRDMLAHLCCDGCALWPRNPWAGAPLLQHPPFPQVWCGPPNRTLCMPFDQTDGPIPMHECRPLSPPGCFRIRLRIPPSLSWRNIGACRPPG